ncbi:MAG TPA: hypothetical protein PLD46_07135 [Hyphomicrobium sp.]|nr:hypothetical protein [Hyphomicrobium sp.]
MASHFPELPPKIDVSNCPSPFAVDLDADRRTQLFCDRELPLEWATAAVWLNGDGTARALGRVASVNHKARRRVQLLTASGQLVYAPRREVFRVVQACREI